MRPFVIPVFVLGIVFPPRLIRDLPHDKRRQVRVPLLPRCCQAALKGVLAALFLLLALEFGRRRCPINHLVPVEGVGHGDARARAAGGGWKTGREDGDGYHLDRRRVRDGHLAWVEAADGFALVVGVVGGFAAQHCELWRSDGDRPLENRIWRLSMTKGVLKWCVRDIEGLKRNEEGRWREKARDVLWITIRKKGVLCSTGREASS